MTTLTVPGNRSLSPLQNAALSWIARWGGRDVVLAIDLTESVGLNDPGRLHLRQIVEKSLVKGDTLYIIPFATTTQKPVSFDYKGVNDIPQILQAIPQNPGSEQGTDIQCAELYVYRYLAQQNQNRLQAQSPIKAQSVIWLTDAPLNLPQGAANQWVEVPASPCGLKDSPIATERTQWMKALPMTQKSIQPGNFQLTVVDISPTVQEFCTPKPGGGEVCLVNSYLWGQLWWQILLGSFLGLTVLGGSCWGLIHWLRQFIPWKITVQINDQDYTFALKHGQKIGLGGSVPGTFYYVDLPGSEAVGYLERCNQTLKVYALTPDLTYNGCRVVNPVKIRRKNRFVTLDYRAVTISIML
jgi:hypothetical protein